MDMNDDDDDDILHPLPLSFESERQRRLAALRAAIWARHAAMTDETWNCLMQSLVVYERACGLLADVAEVKARIHAGHRTAPEHV